MSLLPKHFGACVVCGFPIWRYATICKPCWDDVCAALGLDPDATDEREPEVIAWLKHRDR